MAKGDPQQRVEDAATCWTDLVVSILAVNKFSLELAYGLVDGLRKNGLLDPAGLMKLDAAEIYRRLKLSGYDRGEYVTNLLALRLVGLGTFIRKYGVDAATRVISEKDRPFITDVLSEIYGVGPVVIKNFCLLRGI